jgi:hypothetical protein
VRHGAKNVLVCLQVGLDIASTFRGDHPLLDLALDVIRSHADIEGDGVKSIVLILAAFLRAIESDGNMENAERRCRILAQIRELTQLSLKCT